MRKRDLLFLVLTFILISTSKANFHIKNNHPQKTIGIFKTTDPKLRNIRFGNWGSRPYEYFWANNMVDVKNKKVIDLGVGLPSQYNWYRYVVENLKPTYYVGIDVDDRMQKEAINGNSYDMLHMDMSSLLFPDKEFDIAYCISTFEHIPYQTFLQSIQETHRVLKDDGVLLITLDEHWDKNIPLTHANGWNTLEQSLIKMDLFEISHLSFGLPDFLELIKEYFVPVHDDINVDHKNKIIFSSKTDAVYYQRQNRDSNILHSPEVYNSCVSYAILKKKNEIH